MVPNDVSSSFFFFRRHSCFVSKTSEKRKCPVSYVFSLARFFTPNSLFFFFGGGGGQPGAVSAIFVLFFVFCRRTKETFLVPA